MFKGKIDTIRDVINISRWGVGFKSKRILFLTDLLNHLGFERKGLRSKIANRLEQSSSAKELKVKIKAKDHPDYDIKYRLHDYGDYQSLGECLGGNMYDLPNLQLDYFIDAGANLGFFSMNMFGRYAIKEAISIEPNPVNVDLLKFNLSSFSNCKVFPIAVSGQEGKVVFELLTSNTGHIKGAVGNYESSSAVTVVSKKISTLIPSHWKMEHTLVKIDIEGAEYEVIPEMFSQNIFPQVITGEIHDYLRCGGKELADIITNAGYNVTIDGHGRSGNVCRQILCIRN